MRPPLRKWLIVGALLVAAAGALCWGGYCATKHVPAFYEEALHESPAQQRQDSHNMERKAAALVGDTLRQGHWKATFTQEQINGYLAVDMVEKHPRLLPPDVRDPRVALRHDGAHIGWRSEGRWPAVYSLSLVPYMFSPNVLAVRIHNIRAGAVPVPLGQVVDGLSAAVREFNLRLEWRQVDGDPVALLHLPPAMDSASQVLVLESIELGDDAIVFSGRTERRHGEERASLVLPEIHVADHSTESANRQ